MAPTPIAALTDRLVSSFLQSESSSKRLKRARDAFARKLQHHSYVRTNQFEVSTQFEGLEEKFRVLNRDDLADELYSRMRLLGNHQQKWIPDVLDLLLHLSDNPVHQSNVEGLQGLRQVPQSPPQLKWVDIDREDPFDRNDPIWRDINFTGYSSEEDVLAQSESSGAPLAGSDSPDLTFTEKFSLESVHGGDGEDLVRSLKETQFWNRGGRDSIIVSEADIIKESLLVLLGLPSSIYWRVGDVIELDRRFVVSHASPDALRDVEQYVSDLVLQVDSVRAFVEQPQTVEYVQALQDGVSGHLQRLDQELSGLQSNILTESLSGSLTLLIIVQKVKDAANSVLHLAMLVQGMQLKDPVAALDRLFNLTCQDQALGNEEWFILLKSLFVKTFRRFLESLQKSLDKGSSTIDAGLSLPKFLQGSSPALKKIARTRFALDKTKTSRSQARQMPDFEAVDTDLVPFKDSIRRIYGSYLDSQLTTLSTLVKAEIGSRATQDLNILQYVYLARDISITEALDRIIFRQILKHGGTWDDRFALTDRVRGIYAKVPHIDIHSLSARTVTKSPSHTKDARSPLDLVGRMLVIYGLKPPVSTIIPREALTRYQNVARILLQLRWAKKCLERISYDDRRPLSHILASVRHLCLFFVNTVYDHFTSYTIETLSMRMFEAMNDALDIDNMTRAHESFLDELEDQCLLSERLSPLRDALLNVLSLCGELSERARVSSMTASPRKQLNVDEESSSDVSSDSNEVPPAVGTGAKSVSGPADADQLGNVKARFDKHMLFLVAGLKSASRVKNSGWDILAGKLDWRKAQQRSRIGHSDDVVKGRQPACCQRPAEEVSKDLESEKEVVMTGYILSKLLRVGW
ncbi:MAG: hypothetical protein Q9160_005935 [Pyrenula sp. 1 TL-2023]